MTTRRELVIALAGAFAVPAVALAQPQNKIRRVGFLAVRHVDFVDTDYYYGPFRQGMRDLGYVEGRDFVIEWRSAEGKAERVPALAAELVNLKVDVIVAASYPAHRAAQQATTTTPIVLGNSGDPVANGLVRSLARPGGNITGLTQMGGGALVSKRLEMLLELAPGASRVALLMDPSNANSVNGVPFLLDAAKKRGITILRVDAGSPLEIEAAFSAMRRQNAAALIVFHDASYVQQRQQIADLAAKFHLPAISGARAFADAGMLMSYGVNSSAQYRRAAAFVDKIFKGARPADLPIEQPTRFELVINGRTAKALGLSIPYALRISATEVIE